MQKTYLIILLFFTTTINAQYKTNIEFIEELDEIISINLSKQQLNDVLRKYSYLLNITKIIGHPGNSGSFDIFSVRKSQIYQNNIEQLVSSNNPYKRTLSYILISCTEDESRINFLLNGILKDPNQNCKRWATISLCRLKKYHINEIFDFVAMNRHRYNFDDLEEYYQNMDKHFLKKISLKKIKINDYNFQTLALDTFSKLQIDKEIEEALLKEYKKIENETLQNEFLITFSKLSISDVIIKVKPKYANGYLTPHYMEVLANSSSKNDINLLIDEYNKILKDGLYNKLTDNQKESFLNILVQSKNTAIVKFWLEFMRKADIPKEYYISLAWIQPLLQKEEFVYKLRTSMKQTLNHLNNKSDISLSLVRSLFDSKNIDKESLEIIFKIVKEDSESTFSRNVKDLCENYLIEFEYNKEPNQEVSKGLKKIIEYLGG